MRRLTAILFFALAVPLALAQAPAAPATLTGVAPAVTQPTGVFAAPGSAASAPGSPFKLNIGLEGTGERGEVSIAVQILIIMTLLSVAPSIVLLMTSFTRIGAWHAQRTFQSNCRRTFSLSYLLPDGPDF
jgi:flagellar biosynthetic protein FliP